MNVISGVSQVSDFATNWTFHFGRLVNVLKMIGQHAFRRILFVTKLTLEQTTFKMRRQMSRQILPRAYSISTELARKRHVLVNC